MPNLKRLKYYLFICGLSLLVVGTGLELIFKSTTLDETEYLQTVEERLGNEVGSLQKDLVDVLEYLERQRQIDFSQIQLDTEYPFYIYNNGRLVYWSDYRYVPDYRYISGNYRLRFVSTVRKDFLARRWAISGTRFEVFAFVPLYNNYKVDNNYVQSGFNRKIFSDQKLKINSLQHAEGTPVCAISDDDNCYFKVEFASDYVQNRVYLNGILAILLGCGILLIAIWAYLLARSYAKGDVERGFLTLVTLLLLLRSGMLAFNFPARWISSSLFDSRFFASSSINPSLGDLLLNLTAALFLCLYLFNNYHKFSLSNKFLKAQGLKTRVVSVILAGLMILVLHIEYLAFQTIYHNSQITFDINQSINFELNRVVGFLIFIILSIAIFFVHHVLYKLFEKRNKRKRDFFTNYAVGAALFAIINLIIGQQFFEVLAISVGLTLTLYITALPNYLTKVRYNTFLYFFTIIIGTAILGAFAVFKFEKEREFERKQKFATQFLIDNDNLAEYLLSELNKKLEDDVFIQSTMASPFLSKSIIKSKIRQVLLSSYFDKYDVKIYLYNSNGEPFDDKPGALDPAELREFNVEEYKTDYEGIYYINKLGAEVTKRYLDFVEIKKRGISVGYVIIDLNLKRIIPENVYPELLVDNAFLFPYQDANYSYAVFNGDQILYNSGSFNYNTDFNKELLESISIYETGLSSSGYSHLAVRDPDGRVVVISSNLHPWSDVISNFSFLFLIQVFTLLILTALYALYFSFQNSSLNYSARIQLYLNIAFFLPLFAVSITTLSLINSSFKKEVNEDYYKKARSISSNVSDDLDQYINDLTIDREDLPNKLSQVAKFSGVDVNLFSTRGRLIATSQPLIYENNLLSKYINPVAYTKIKEYGENAYIARESVGTLTYNTTYYGVKSFGTGDLIGILSIPFFQSEYALEQNQIEVLSNVINIFTIIFIVFLLISYLAAKWLTFPLSFITQKLKKTTLTGFNEPLVWKAEDEIGLMVGEYNKMLINLEESKKALARSEKETAWREIAQQVAHEIKNPLTPMKLTLQHLSRKLLGRPDEKDLERPINTLLHEIETLNDIASSFSSFAKLPIPENERYDIVPVIRKSVNLHSATKHVKINLDVHDEHVYTLGDEQLMGRIISNIIINAVQASEEEKTIDITLNVSDNRRLLLEIKDDGPGIDESIRGKVFLPNFSTKETGSGIGLAIAKHGVEHAGGKIWFETEDGNGTSFYIELPMVE
ncbi:HAMP domain-containing histidine kinase [Fulvivirga sp. RKSG066]|uniref:sensor histidine kinase n=1 Tax=Fulvivirga aurantia TaxID=2529383 RepID=UPI0012BB7365|nr:HAMP domain-containing sensor histidine kinase [Fulvivirga aurantia]MTI21260.1 HAMP domain-containing histidine kinase [Fulvivirga aurantia]